MMSVLLVLIAGGLGWTMRSLISSIDQTAVPIGSYEDFAVGTITEREVGQGFFDSLGVERESSADTVDASVGSTLLFVVHHPDDGLLVLLGRSPFLGCRVQPIDAADAAQWGVEAPDLDDGGFVDPCHGGLFDLDGRHVAGPGMRGLDRFIVRYLADGTVAVDLTQLQEGLAASGA